MIVHVSSPAVKSPSIAVFETPAVLGLELPLDQRRFILPTDEKIVAAYDFLQQSVTRRLLQCAGVTGATAFGSTTKGYAQVHRSDLDATAFIETERLMLKQNLTGSQVVFNDWGAFHDGPRKQAAYSKLLFDGIKPHESGVALPINFGVFPLGHEYLRALAKIEADDAADRNRYDELRASDHNVTAIDDIADWAEIPSHPYALQGIPGLKELIRQKRGDGSVVDALSVHEVLDHIASDEQTEYARLRRKMFWDNRLGSSLPPRLFNLAITPQLGEYRMSFLEGLADAEAPEQAWQRFRGRLMKFEDGKKHPRNVRSLNYPQTLDDAFAHYAV